MEPCVRRRPSIHLSQSDHHTKGQPPLQRSEPAGHQLQKMCRNGIEKKNPLPFQGLHTRARIPHIFMLHAVAAVEHHRSTSLLYSRSFKRIRRGMVAGNGSTPALALIPGNRNQAQRTGGFKRSPWFWFTPSLSPPRQSTISSTKLPLPRKEERPSSSPRQARRLLDPNQDDPHAANGAGGCVPTKQNIRRKESTTNMPWRSRPYPRLPSTAWLSPTLPTTRRSPTRRHAVTVVPS